MIPKNEDTFYFKSKGNETGETFEGNFTIKMRLNLAEQMEVAIRADRYSAGSKSLSESFKRFNEMMAELSLRIIKAPGWWTENDDGWKLDDANVVAELFAQTTEVKAEWTNRVKGAADQAEKKAEAHPADADAPKAKSGA